MATDAQHAARVRETQRANWTVSAPGWVQRREDMRETTRPVTDRLIAAAAVAPGMKVVDLACGVGDPAFPIAAIVGPSGSVLGLDLTPAMVDAASSFAREHGVVNVEFRAIPSEVELGLDAERFDAATCRFGLMFMADPSGAARSLGDALKPGGRIAVSTWGPPERVPFMTLPNQILGQYVPAPPPDPDARTPFTIPTEADLSAVLSKAGFIDVSVQTFETVMNSSPSPEAYWDSIAGASGMVERALAALTPEQRAAAREDALFALRERFPDGGVSLGGQVLIGAGVKPA